MRPRLRQRLRPAAAGAILAVLGLGATALFVLEWDGRQVAFLLFAPVYLVAGLLGVELAFRALRGDPPRPALFLRAVSRLRPAPLSLGFAAFCGFAFALARATHDEGGLVFAEIFGFLWAATFVNVAAHELGHLLAARLVGFPVRRLLVGPFELLRTTAGWRPRLCREWLFVVGGLVLVDVTAPSPRRLAVFAAGGPAASLALLLLLLGPTASAAPHLFEADRPLPNLLFACAAGAFLLFAGNLIPISSAGVGYPSDGFVIRWCLARMREVRRTA